jgi:hypothetical protein
MDETLNKLAAKTYLLEETKAKYNEIKFEMFKLQNEMQIVDKEIVALQNEILNLHIILKNENQNPNH